MSDIRVKASRPDTAGSLDNAQSTKTQSKQTPNTDLALNLPEEQATNSPKVKVRPLESGTVLPSDKNAVPNSANASTSSVQVPANTTVVTDPVRPGGAPGRVEEKVIAPQAQPLPSSQLQQPQPQPRPQVQSVQPQGQRLPRPPQARPLRPLPQTPQLQSQRNTGNDPVAGNQNLETLTLPKVAEAFNKDAQALDAILVELRALLLDLQEFLKPTSSLDERFTQIRETLDRADSAKLPEKRQLANEAHRYIGKLENWVDFYCQFRYSPDDPRAEQEATKVAFFTQFRTTLQPLTDRLVALNADSADTVQSTEPTLNSRVRRSPDPTDEAPTARQVRHHAPAPRSSHRPEFRETWVTSQAVDGIEGTDEPDSQSTSDRQVPSTIRTGFPRTDWPTVEMLDDEPSQTEKAANTGDSGT